MSDAIKHECGIALIRLKKSLSYYQDKYGTNLYGLNKLYLMLEKQRNRGQDGAGIATLKFDMPPGYRYISRKRSNDREPTKQIFTEVFQRINDSVETNPNLLQDSNWLKRNVPYIAELMIGHLRYGTHGNNRIEACHPFLRQNNWMTKSLILEGNFNMTNVDELFQYLVRLGQNPKEKSDTVTVMEKIGHFLDTENQVLFNKYKEEGYGNEEITKLISENLDLQRVLTRSIKDFDGGYVMVGMVGHGDAFVIRDPAGIRPAFYYDDDEVVVAASERQAIQTVFNAEYKDIQEVKPGHALIIKKNGKVSQEQCIEPLEKKACSFERIYFSRGNDAEIYRERMDLGRLVVPKVLEKINYELDNTVFSFIPNTAESSYYGMIKGLEDYLNTEKIDLIKNKQQLSDEEMLKILSRRPRLEKAAIKDVKFRTFISQDSGRDDLVTHAYDVTYGIINPGKDSLVVIDDSIVRGTTLKQSILRILDRLYPKQIIVVSSAPQIRYPDCYGIDMSKMKDFVAFRAAIALLEEQNKEDLLEEVYERCKAQLGLPKEQVKNEVKRIYEPFTEEQVSDKIAMLLTPPSIQAEVKVVYQSIETMHQALPHSKGDWYFSGDYPTPGGNKVVNQAFINYMEGSNARAY